MTCPEYPGIAKGIDPKTVNAEKSIMSMAAADLDAHVEPVLNADWPPTP
jgi:hypothetical protein